MKMSIGEKKILFVFGCPNREATVERLYQVAHLIPDPAGKKVVETLADKLDSEGVEKWISLLLLQYEAGDGSLLPAQGYFESHRGRQHGG